MILGINDTIIKRDIFNVGSGENVDVLTIANLLRSNYKSNIDINITQDFRIGDIRHNLADLSNIKQKLNYKPKYSFEEGMKYFTTWVESQQVELSSYDKSINELKEKGLYK